MRVRKFDLTSDGSGEPLLDMSFGHGAQDYWQDVPEAPLQLAQDRLELYTGQWFLDTSDGMPWRTDVMGYGTEASRDRAIRARILSTQGVTGISTYASQVNRDSRVMSVQPAITTAFDKTAIVTLRTASRADVRYAR